MQFFDAVNDELRIVCENRGCPDDWSKRVAQFGDRPLVVPVRGFPD